MESPTSWCCVGLAFLRSRKIPARSFGKGIDVLQVIVFKGGQGRNRTTDTRIFSPLLYRLSYLGMDICERAIKQAGAV